MTTSQNALEDVSLLCTVEDSVSEAKKDKQTKKNTILQFILGIHIGILQEIRTYLLVHSTI